MPSYKTNDPRLPRFGSDSWVVIDIPYSAGAALVLDYPVFPDLEEGELATFGTTRTKLWGEFSDKILAMHKVQDLFIRAQVMALPTEEQTEAAEALFSIWLTRNPDYQEAYEAQELRAKIKLWQETHPDMVAYRNRLDELDRESLLRTFCGRGLSKPGGQIEMSYGVQYIIGDSNSLGGTRVGAQAFSGGVIVHRYRVLWRG